MVLDKYINKEVYFVAGGEDEEDTEVYITDDWSELLNHLGEMQPDLESETRVFHGVLTTAEYLPSSFSGKTAFVVCLNHDDPTKGYCIESEANEPNGLANELTLVLSVGGAIPTTTCDIDDFYILYGYQMETCISVRDDIVDEEAVHTCKKIAAETEIIGKMARLNFEQSEEL